MKHHFQYVHWPVLPLLYEKLTNQSYTTANLENFTRPEHMAFPSEDYRGFDILIAPSITVTFFSHPVNE